MALRFAAAGCEVVIVIKGLVETVVVKEKSSMPRPSSAPVALKSVQRIKNVELSAILNPVIVAETDEEFKGAETPAATDAGAGLV